MTFQVSPGISVREIDLTNSVPSVPTVEGAIVGVFPWGPLNTRVLVTSEDDLKNRFGKPVANTSWNNYETFFTAADFLAYGNRLYVTRVATTGNANTALNADNAGVPGFQVSNEEEAAARPVIFMAKYPGTLGNSIQYSICQNASAWSLAYPNTTSDAKIIINTNASFGWFLQSTVSGVDQMFQVNDLVEIKIGRNVARLLISSITAETLTSTIDAQTYVKVNFSNRYTLSTNVQEDSNNVSVRRLWRYNPNTKSAPLADKVHIAVIDRLGAWSGVRGTVLEVFENVDVVNVDATNADGSAAYYKTVINDTSNYLWAGSTNIVRTGTNPTYTSLTGGSDGLDERNVALSDLARGYDLYVSPEQVDISFIMQGKAIGNNDTGVANYIIDNICEVRKDCIALISPALSDVVNVNGSEVDNIVEFRNNLNSSSYAFIDSGYKYRYDKYNDTYRWTPLNGDMAGLMVRTTAQREPWFSPAGYNRGIIKNVVKLAFNPNEAERDTLYANDINPVITQSGVGTLLFGDKTALGETSAFDRINVRRLFIVLQKSITRAARNTLFEFNDEFTRAQFRNLVEPYLRDVLGRRGIYDFRVVCDETNNTPEVIDRNEFIGDIYIKPARSINYIQLNFVAVRTGVEFQEIVG